MPRRPRVTQAALIEAAADLVNREGPASLSLSRLATQLGVQTPSLYNHVNGLPGLRRELALLNARLLGDCLANAAIGRSGPAAVLAIALSYREYIKANPGLYMVSLRPAHIEDPVDLERQAAEERTVTIALAVIASFGLAGDDAIHAVRALRSLVHGFATLEAAGGFGLPLSCDDSFQRMVTLFTRGLEQAQPA